MKIKSLYLLDSFIISRCTNIIYISPFCGYVKVEKSITISCYKIFKDYIRLFITHSLHFVSYILIGEIFIAAA